ncbi:LapA family protein [Georgfuchsia toluolica]|uniref:LapA family protein n=1 Tax=Georgfuchsia toluolica TaxID=424218 RepID=A0A916N944_9PROT|nr:lipopolysaccharide assembly protein LapA domain-containing protein [Georgfuchsia toluolica]CAG4883420.1 LapA family protein [Georgfuchsia toluolica]
MKTLIWILRFVVFFALFGLAVKNSATVDLRFYFDRHVDAPLSLVVLGVFVLGVVVGISAATATLLRQRRELGRLKRRVGDRS